MTQNNEHPAVRAARMIRELHVQTVELIDKGQVFVKDGVIINTEMRAACIEQIAVCDNIMARRDWSPSTSVPAEILRSITEEIAKRQNENPA